MQGCLQPSFTTFAAIGIALKKLLYLILLFPLGISGQAVSLEILADDTRSATVIDSVGYSKLHPDALSAQKHTADFVSQLRNAGWLAARTVRDTLQGAVLKSWVSIGPRAKNIHIYIGSDPIIKQAIQGSRNDSVSMPVSSVEAFLNRTLAKLESMGYPLSVLQLGRISATGDNLQADLISQPGTRRQVNDIVINGYDKFPAGHRKQVARLYRNKSVSNDNLRAINGEFAKFRFVTQTRYPEILFTTDTTRVFVYLEKAKANRFDGFIGFSNDDEQDGGKVRFNGYLDLLLVNILNTGEEFSLFWKSDGRDQKTFDAGITLPYIFKSPFGLKASLNIFRQDSTFQNTRTAIGLGYFFNYNTRLYLGYEATESSDIQNAQTSSVSDYKNSFATGTLEFTAYKAEDFLFPEKSRAMLKSGFGKRNSATGDDAQWFLEAMAMHNFYLGERNIINLRTHNYYLSSERYLVSELFRFGGIRSVRGFNENSLQASLTTSLLSEYRYVLAPGLYLHSIADYAYYRDQSRDIGTGNSGSLLGLGFGFGLLTNNGLFNLVYANGTPDGQAIKLSNSIVHISFQAKF